MLKEAGGSLKATAGKQETTYHFIHTAFVTFRFFQPESCFPWQAMLKTCQHIFNIVDFDEHTKHAAG